jgi:drug/metabolite transporter (DMT)-like permease
MASLGGRGTRLTTSRRLATNRGMESKALPVLVVVAFSGIGVLGDYFLKLASEEPDSLRSPWFYVGFVVYASTAFGWVFVMKYLKLSTIGVVYSVSMILLLTAIGVIAFRESLSVYELAGLVMAVTTLVLLTRFA